ncbi:MAG: hypothetical protein Q9166_001146 [cf. Caloplaca sp. 2 TL-2023]
MVFHLKSLFAKKSKIQRPNTSQSKVLGGAHGGEYDPNDYNSLSSTLPNHGGNYDPKIYTESSSNRGTDHGGDYDPKQFDPNPLSEQRHLDATTSREMTSNVAQANVPSPHLQPSDVERWDVPDWGKHDEEAALVSRDRNQIFHHRDFLRRPFSGRRDNRFLNPKDGRPKELVVQCSENVLANRSGANWSRISVQNKGPWMFHLAHWASGEFAALKWLPACAVLTVVVSQIERISEPAYLCFVDDGMQNVQQWRNENGDDAALEYVMVSYTGKQFVTDNDKDSLHAIGRHAAREAHVEAYWLSCSCLGTTDSEREQNVWRISDVIRGAFQIVIAVAGPAGVKEKGKLPVKLLHEWGDRVWTLPELLLSPERNDIRIYTLNRSLDPGLQLKQCLDTGPDQINRRNFSRFWKDDAIVGQLMDHYEGSVILSRLELIATALKCLERRDTIQYLPGDLSYSLMGLLRQRPNAQKSDSAFQAFARLSLANDSNMLLERLICVLPQSLSAPWYSFQDHWTASLWDIYPRTQVCGIGANDTVILDGARAATIRWKSFKKVILRGNRTLKRRLAVIALTFVSPIFIVSIAMLARGSGVSTNSVTAIGGVLIAFSLLVLLSSPYLINEIYLGKVWSAQPWFFGIEGYMPLAEIEKRLFGANLNRLSWSTTSSSLSRHDFLNHNHFKDYCEGQDPISDKDVAVRIQSALRSTESQEKIFTLVDTYTMTVTLFSAVRPPVAVLACGEEGGMQRALLCSYDWTNNTLYRETVVRMETPVYWRMNPVRRVRLGLKTCERVD